MPVCFVRKGPLGLVLPMGEERCYGNGAATAPGGDAQGFALCLTMSLRTWAAGMPASHRSMAGPPAPHSAHRLGALLLGQRCSAAWENTLG